MKIPLVAGLIVVVFSSLVLEAQQSPEERLNILFDTSHPVTYVAAHRGDWRNAPENSLQSLKCATTLGVDIVEMDVKKTKDNQLIVMHDKTLDRTTTGSGSVSDHSLKEIKALKLRSGNGHPTSHIVPTFQEELAAARNNVVLDVDQGWDYFDDVVREARAAGMLSQIIVNVLPNTSLDAYEKKVGDIPEDLTIMIVVNMERPDAAEVIRSYRAHKRTIIQCIFGNDRLLPATHGSASPIQAPLWINSLWPDQNGGHDDDRAVELGQQDQSWGWLLSHGVNVLQTDRPKELLDYLHAHLAH